MLIPDYGLPLTQYI